MEDLDAAIEPAPRAFFRRGTPLQRATAQSILGGLLVQGCLAISGPLAARILGVEDRGYLALLMIFPSLLWQLGTLGMPFAIPFFLSENVSGRQFLRKILPVFVSQSVVLSCVHVAILILFVRSHTGPVTEAAWWTLLALPGLITSQYGLAMLQGTQHLFAFNLLRVLPILGYAAALVVVFVSDVGDLPVVSLVWSAANLLAGTLTLVYGMRLTARYRQGATGAPPAYTRMFGFGMKSLLGSVPPVESFRIDQALVGALFSPSILGLYVVAFGYTNLPGFVGKGIGSIAYPHIAERRNVESIWRFFLLNLLVSIPLAIGFAILAPYLLPLLFGESFARAVPLVGILFIENVLTSSRRVLSDGMRGVGAPGAGTISELAYLGLLVLLVPLMTSLGVRGFVGAMAVSAGLSLILMVILTLRQGNAATDSGSEGGQLKP